MSVRAVAVAAITAVSTFVLAGCGVGVDTRVKEYEGGDVDVTSCHKTGERITEAGTYPSNAEDGDSTDEVWKCTITEPVGSVEKCYVVHESKVETIVRGVKCSPGG
jgi:hypothetical protein